jgi:DNA-binding beta-propeller fold protein YncE
MTSKRRLFALPLLVALCWLTAASVDDRILMGEDSHQYAWSSGWGASPEGEYGNTHGCVAVDSAGRIWFNTDTEKALVVLNRDGSLHKSFGKEFAGGLHGMTIRTEGKEEFVYLAHTGRQEVIKATTDGEVVWKIGIPTESGHYPDPSRYRPTDVSVAPDGSVFVADGYGSSWVHKFDSEGKYLLSIGGPGKEPGKFQTPHGIYVDDRGEETVLLVADRQNGRLQVFDLDGNFKRVVDGMLRLPCNVVPNGKDLIIPDLKGRVTVLNEKYELICQLGDNPDPSLRAKHGAARAEWKDGLFTAPHGAAADKEGNIYVVDWNFLGRISRLERLPVASPEVKPEDG